MPQPQDRLQAELDSDLRSPTLTQRGIVYSNLIKAVWRAEILTFVVAGLGEKWLNDRKSPDFESLALGVVWGASAGFLSLSFAQWKMGLPEGLIRAMIAIAIAPLVMIVIGPRIVILPAMTIIAGFWTPELRYTLRRSVQRGWNLVIASWNNTTPSIVPLPVQLTSYVVQRCLRTGDTVGLHDAIEDLITAYSQSGRSGEYPELLAPVLRYARERRDRPQEIYFLVLISSGLAYRGEHVRALEMTAPLLHELPASAMALKQALQRAARSSQIDPKLYERAAVAEPLLSLANNVLCLYQEIGAYREAREVGESAVAAAVAVDRVAQQIPEHQISQTGKAGIVDSLQLNLADLLIDQNESPDVIESHLGPGRERRKIIGEHEHDMAGLAAYIEAKAAARRDRLPQKEVEAALDRAIKFYTELGNPKFAAQLWLWKGVIRHRWSDVKGCREALDAANVLDEMVLDRIFPVCPDAAKPALIQSIRHRFDAWLSLFFDHFASDPAACSQAFELCLRRKGLATSIQASRRAEILIGRFPELAETLREHLQVCRSLADAASGKEAPVIQQELEQRRRSLEIELSRSLPDIGMSTDEPRRLALALALPAGTLMIDYLRFDRYDFDAIHPQPLRAEARYAAFVISSAQPEQVTVLDLGLAESIDELVRDVTEDTDPSEDTKDKPISRGLGTARPAPSGARYREACIKLFERILKPCLSTEAAGTSQRLLLSPDAALHRVSFDALRNPAGQGLLIDQWDISYSSAVCGLIAAKGHRDESVSRPSIVVADPDFDVASVHSSPSTSRDGIAEQYGPLGSLRSGFVQADRLPMAGTEGLFVREQLGNAELWSGQQAMDGLLKQRCKSPRVLHICTHGWFLRDDIETQLTSASGFHLSGSVDPFLRSWLLLAGYNVWRADGVLRTGTEDGIVTAADILALDLSGTELVVLSACETGLGAIQNGEGVAGLRRAFVAAGAACLVMTLWRVNDLSSMLLMQKFYHAIGKCGPLQAAVISAALRQAKQDVRRMTAAEALHCLQSLPVGVDEHLVEANREWLRGHAPEAIPFEHPVYWGGFVLERATM